MKHLSSFIVSAFICMSTCSQTVKSPIKQVQQMLTLSISPNIPSPKVGAWCEWFQLLAYIYFKWPVFWISFKYASTKVRHITTERFNGQWLSFGFCLLLQDLVFYKAIHAQHIARVVLNTKVRKGMKCLPLLTISSLLHGMRNKEL